MKIYFITRTFVIEEDVTDCGNIRNRYVDFLRKKYDVVVVTPNYTNDNIIDDGHFIRIPYKFRKFDYYAERLGLYEDYLDKWTKKTIAVLKGRVNQEDIIFATTGGELAGVKIASRLKEFSGCKTVINFHDPINYTTVNGIMTGGLHKKLHVNRDRSSRKYINSADRIITSSDSYRLILEDLFPSKIGKIKNVYFGYLDKIDVDTNKVLHAPIRMVYAGSMGLAQRADRIMDAWGDIDNVVIEYIGNIPQTIKDKAARYHNVKLTQPMEHSIFLKYMSNEADIGLVSLIGAEWGACFPSKIFDLINLHIPILAILPDGDAKDKVNGGYGYAVNEGNLGECQSCFTKLIRNYDKIVKYMEQTEDDWDMAQLFDKVYEMLDELVAAE